MKWVGAIVLGGVVAFAFIGLVGLLAIGFEKVAADRLWWPWFLIIMVPASRAIHAQLIKEEAKDLARSLPAMMGRKH